MGFLRFERSLLFVQKTHVAFEACQVCQAQQVRQGFQLSSLLQVAYGKGVAQRGGTYHNLGEARARAQASKEQGEGVFGERMVRLGQEEEGSSDALCRGRCTLTALLIQIQADLLPPLRRKWEVTFPGPVSSNMQLACFAIHILQTQRTQLADAYACVQQDPEDGPIACAGPPLRLVVFSIGTAGLQQAVKFFWFDEPECFLRHLEKET
jgi:hypothetical protein